MEDILIQFCKFNQEIEEIQTKIQQVYKQILNYTFTNGKYKGNKIIDVIEKDFKYVSSYLRNNFPDKINNNYLYFDRDRMKLPTILYYMCINYRKYIIQHNDNEEYEQHRREYCLKHNLDYNLDYEFRHNEKIKRFWNIKYNKYNYGKY